MNNVGQACAKAYTKVSILHKIINVGP